MNENNHSKTSLAGETLGLLRRSPGSSVLVLLLIALSSMGQVVTLGSLYPILQIASAGGETILRADNTVNRYIVNAIQVVGLEPTIGNILLVFVLVGVLYSFLAWLSETYQGIYLRKFEVGVRRELIESVINARWEYLLALKHGEFVNVVTREVELYKAAAKCCLLTLNSILHSAALVFLAVWINWKMTLLALAILGMGSLVFVPLFKYADMLGHVGTNAFNQLGIRLLDALRAMKTVKSLSLETYLMRIVEPSIWRTAGIYFRQGIISSAQARIGEVFAFSAVSAMLYIGIVGIAIPMPHLMMIFVVFLRLVPQVRSGIDHYHRGYGALPSVRIVRRHMGQAFAARQPTGGRSVSLDWREIEFREVGFGYVKGQPPVLKRLSFTISRGEFWAIVGPTGCGKTTILDLLLGLILPQEGEVLIDGVSIKQIDLRSWHSQVAYLGQNVFVFGGKLRSNLLWGAGERVPSETELIQAVSRARLEMWGGNGVNILDKEILESGNNLSGGEKQRVALARIFLREPTIMILDEPTTGLDAHTEQEIISTIEQLRGQITIVMVTHREQLVQTADRLIRLAPSGGAQVSDAVSKFAGF